MPCFPFRFPGSGFRVPSSALPLAFPIPHCHNQPDATTRRSGPPLTCPVAAVSRFPMSVCRILARRCEVKTEEWQERLERVFLQDGIVGGHLIPVLHAESEYGKFVASHFHGQLVLSDSFQAFFIDTLRLAEARYRESSLFPALQWYAYLLLLELSNFRTIRAAEILFVHGRAGQGYGLLRDLKDRAMLLGAVGNRYTTLMAISGVDGGTGKSNDFLARIATIKKRRKKTEDQALSMMTGPKSGLSPNITQCLRKWEEFFHLEVHGARLTSIFEDVGWKMGRELLPILPKPNIDSLANYMNRFCEVSWMVLRSFPILQLKPQDFGIEWAEKWRILDESFLVMADELRKLGKEIAAAIMELVSKKFAFGPDAVYPPEDAAACPVLGEYHRRKGKGAGDDD